MIKVFLNMPLPIGPAMYFFLIKSFEIHQVELD